MRNTIGNIFTVTIFGESHGTAIGAVLDGLPAGIALDEDFIYAQMDKRKAKGNISTKRREEDKIQILSGYFQGYTTGTPFTILIPNNDVKSKDYEKTKHILRPSHADFTAFEKYFGYQDYRGGGHFSGRISAPIVAAGAIALQILNARGIHIATHIAQCHDIKDTAFLLDDIEQQIKKLHSHEFPVIDQNIGKSMIEKIENSAKAKDSVGGILESIITGIPTGLGQPFFDSVESKLSHLLFSIPAVKGVSFGLGFDFSSLYGSQANDAFYYDEKVRTKTNHNGGINGGITNGMPIQLKTVIKPTPSIFQSQETIDYHTKETIQLQLQGRHDPAIIHRACVVVDSMLAIGILDLLLERDLECAFHNNKERNHTTCE